MLWMETRRILAGTVVLAAVSSAEAEPSFTSLNPPSGGLSGVSADGSFVVGTQREPNGFGPQQALRWSGAGGFQSLGFLHPNSYSAARSVSADGAIVVGVASSGLILPPPVSTYAEDRAFLWTQAGGMVSLGDLPGGEVFAQANGISEDGSIVVGYSVGASSSEAFLWTAGEGMVGLGMLPGADHSVARAISADGSTIVGYSSAEAFRWTEASGLLSIEGGMFASSFANGVSADGSVIVGDGSTASGTQAFRWDESEGMVELGDLPGGTFRSTASGVSGDGSIVVGQGVGTASFEAFFWTEATGMLTLEQVLTAYGLDLTGWHLTNAAAISTDGTTIIGSGRNPSNQTRSFVAVIPEPSRGAMLGAGLLGLVLVDLRRHRRRGGRTKLN